MSTDRSGPRLRPPLDGPALERLALRYVERFATTQGRLARYLERKVRERGWAGEAAADPMAIAGRMAARGYVDDLGFGEAKAAAMTRRGLGERRVRSALRYDGLAEEALAEVLSGDAETAFEAALAFARRKRIGPFASAVADRALRQKHIGAMLRAGHAPSLATRIAALAPGDDPDALREC